MKVVIEIQAGFFAEHFREFIHPLLCNRLEEDLGQKDLPDMCIGFFADGVVCAIMRWLLSKDCMMPEAFVDNIRSLVQSTATSVYQQMLQQS